jgi:hypothetical protein
MFHPARPKSRTAKLIQHQLVMSVHEFHKNIALTKSLMPQRNHRIHARRLMRRKPPGKHRHGCERSR